MRRLIISWTMIFVTGVLAGAERRPIGEVSLDEMIVETQPAFTVIPADHFAICWWIPHEYWMASFSQDDSLTEVAKQELLKTLEGVSVLGVVQADIELLGTFDFYAKNAIENNLAITFTDADGQTRPIQPLKDVDPGLNAFLESTRPILAASMGRLGENFQFFVLGDETKTGQRLLNPYQEGKITIELSTRNGEAIKTDLFLPLNSLYVPRKCPNGRDAHISWKYCPWTGERLEE